MHITFDIVNKKGLMDLFAISRFECIVIIDNVYGRCCGGNGKAGDKFVRGCGGYVGGKSALSHYKDGFFGTPSVTTWERGTNQGNLRFVIKIYRRLFSNY